MQAQLWTRRHRQESSRRLTRARASRPAFLAMFCALLLACGAESAQQSFKLGEQAAAQGDFSTAIIHFKNAVQAEPENPEWRLALGKLQLESGNGEAALKEIERARKLGLNTDEVSRNIALASLLTGDRARASEEVSLNGNLEEGPWALVQARLDLLDGKHAEAAALLETLVAQAPDNVEALRTLVQARILAGDSEAARNALGRLLDLRPGDIRGLLVSATLDLEAKQAEAARETFLKVLGLSSKHYGARLGLAAAELALEDVDAAEKSLDALGANANNDPRAMFMRARIAQQRGKPDTALVYLRSVLQIQPQNLQALALAGELSFRLRDYASAEGFFARLLEEQPDNAQLRTMYSVVLMRQGKRELANDALQDSEQLSETGDARLLALLGTSYLEAGDELAARESLERASALAPDSLAIRSQLALAKLETGNPQEAAADFAAIRSEAPDYLQAAIFEILALAAAGDRAGAMQRADNFVMAQGETSPVPWNLRGYLRARNGEGDAARSDFESALARKEDFDPAEINLARLAASNQDYTKAREHLMQVLERSPHQLDALLQLAKIALVEGNREEAQKIWREALDNHPDAVQPQLLLARELRRAGAIDEAVTLAESFLQLAPNLPVAQYEYARSMLLARRPADALPVAQRLLDSRPESREALVLMSAIQLQLGDQAGYEGTLNQLAKIDPSAPQALIGLGRLAFSQRRLDEALDYAGKLAASDNDKLAPVGLEMKGDIAAARGDFAAAAEAYGQAYEQTSNTGLLIKLDTAERRSGRDHSRLEDWVKQHPDDILTLYALAVERFRAGDDEEAELLFERVIERDTKHAAALNNLAWLYDKRGDERAPSYAGRAYEADPSNPEIADTLGWILLKDERYELALNLLEKAHDKRPGNPEIAFHYASAQAGAGNKHGARETLEKLLAAHEKFPSRTPAENLMRELSSP